MTDKQKQKEIANFKAKLNKEINTVQGKADLLSGRTQISHLNKKGKKVDAKKKEETDKNSNLPKFMKFMEQNYKGSMLKVELKKRI